MLSTVFQWLAFLLHSWKGIVYLLVNSPGSAYCTSGIPSNASWIALITAGPPWTWNSQTSSPVKLAGPGLTENDKWTKNRNLWRTNEVQEVLNLNWVSYLKLVDRFCLWSNKPVSNTESYDTNKYDCFTSHYNLMTACSVDYHSCRVLATLVQDFLCFNTLPPNHYNYMSLTKI